MKYQPNHFLYLFLLTFFAIAPMFELPAAADQEPGTLEQFEKAHATITSVARLLKSHFPAGSEARLDWAIRDLGTRIEEIRKIQEKVATIPADMESIRNHREQCQKGLIRFSEILQFFPGLVRVATQEVQSSPFAFTQGRNLAVLWCKGDAKALPSLDRILVTPESPNVLSSTRTGEGHHFCFLEFSGLEIGEHPYRIDFRGLQSRSHQLIARVVKPTSLRVKILEEGGSTPVPCMISLTSLTDYTYRIPQEALDFDGHFDDGPRNRTLLSLGAPYWKELTACCVDGVATFEVFAGKWKLSVAKGIEYVPHIEEFGLGDGEGGEKTVVMKRWVDSASLGWYSGDGHVHTFQQTDDQHKRIATWAKANDIHVINTMKMGDINKTYFEHAGFGKDFRYQSGDTVLVPGQECPRTAEIGHTQAINLGSGMVRDTDHYYLYDLMFDGAHAQGALTGYCHAGWLGFNVHRDMSLNVPRGKVDFFEVLQFSQLNPKLWYEFLNLGCKVTAFAGSDMPWGGSIGEVRVYAFIGEEGFDADRWFEAVGRGRTFVSNGPMIELKVNEAFPGDEIALSQPSRVSVKARTWGNALIGVPETLEVVVHGEVIRATTSVADITSPLEMNFDLPVEEGIWIAARASGSGKVVAHTSPIYLTVNGKGFAKWKDMQNLLTKRNKSLAEIEELVATEKVKNPTGPISIQGDGLLERVGIARGIYEKMEKELSEKEGPSSH